MAPKSKAKGDSQGKPKPHKCPNCDKGFDSRKDVALHMRSCQHLSDVEGFYMANFAPLLKNECLFESEDKPCKINLVNLDKPKPKTKETTSGQQQGPVFHIETVQDDSNGEEENSKPTQETPETDLTRLAAVSLESVEASTSQAFANEGAASEVVLGEVQTNQAASTSQAAGDEEGKFQDAMMWLAHNSHHVRQELENSLNNLESDFPCTMRGCKEIFHTVSQVFEHCLKVHHLICIRPGSWTKVSPKAILASLAKSYIQNCGLCGERSVGASQIDEHAKTHEAEIFKELRQGHRLKVEYNGAVGQFGKLVPAVCLLCVTNTHLPPASRFHLYWDQGNLQAHQKACFAALCRHWSVDQQWSCPCPSCSKKGSGTVEFAKHLEKPHGMKVVSKDWTGAFEEDKRRQRKEVDEYGMPIDHRARDATLLYKTDKQRLADVGVLYTTRALQNVCRRHGLDVAFVDAMVESFGANRAKNLYVLLLGANNVPL